MLNKKKAGGAAKFVNTKDKTSGLEDLAHGTDDCGLPFFLVDGAVCTTRSELDAALGEVEQKRFEKVLKLVDDSNHPWVDDTEPPPELNMNINLSSQAKAELRALEEERRFNKDISDLTFWPPEAEKDEVCTTADTLTDVEVLPDTDQERLRLKLEQLRSSYEQSSDPGPDTETITPKFPERPSIRRQGTFEISRKKEGGSNAGSNIGIEGAASTKSAQPPKPLHQDRASLEDLRRQNQIINQVGDLLVELGTLYQQNNRGLTEGSSYTYTVTVTPAGGASNCTIEPIADPKSSIVRTQNQAGSRNSHIKIFSPPNKIRSESFTNSAVIGRNSFTAPQFIQNFPVAFSEGRARSHILSTSFLKVPAPAKYCHGKKRD